MSLVVPDLEWYARISSEKNTVPRCPFATVKTCPRFYQNLSLLGKAGSTKIDPAEDERLLEFWKKDDLWPRTAEQETSIFGPEGESKYFDNFCPEVTSERFGYFASYLGRYADEIDKDVVHGQLVKGHAVKNDWRWSWASVDPMHYTDCPLYSVLEHRAGNSASASEEDPWYKKPLGIIILGLVISIVGGLILSWFL